MTVELCTRQLDQEMENSVKKKRTRRGKKRFKRRGLMDIAATTLDLSLGDRFSDLENLPSTSENSCDCSKIRKTRRRLLRPCYSPKAPENSTQFIMDDHCENINLFPSLYSPVKFGQERYDLGIDDQDVDVFDEMTGRELAHQVPAEYVQDDYLSFDNTVAEFMQDDFEKVFRIAREDELNKLSKEDLIQALFEMEQKLEKLNSSRSTIIEEKQRGGISKMKVENRHIQEENERLQSAIDGIKCGQRDLANDYLKVC